MSRGLPVDFGVDKRFVFDILTSDISTAESILDLIDNSIDAARRDIGRASGLGAVGSLPESYQGYYVDLTINADRIEIRDNCSGIEPNLLATKAFRLGARFEQSFSIGMYGVGLIRAFWKLGAEGYLLTDTGAQAYELKFSKSVLNETDIVDATERQSSGQKVNHFRVENLTAETVMDSADERWIAFLEQRVRTVLGICIRKGLVVRLNGKVIQPFGPEIRKDIPELRFEKPFVTSEGVDVWIEVGVHPNYRFVGESGHSAENNKKITKELGWYVVCNDRIVLVHDLSEKVGWKNVWHSEYNGFVGWVHFKSRDARLLPWDSTKSDISLEKRSQREVAPLLRQMADSYRQANRNYRYSSGLTGCGKRLVWLGPL